MLYSFDNHETSTDHAAPFFTHEGPTDEQLMLSVKMGEETALETLYKRHGALLRTIAVRVINNDTDAEDLVQEIFCEVWRQAAHYDETKGKALGWLVTLARRRAIDRLRKKQTSYQRASDRLEMEIENQPTFSPRNGVEDGATAGDRAEILQKVISTLPEAQQEALKLAFYQGMSQRQIASHTGIPLGTIKTRLELAVRKVKTGILALGGANEWGAASR